MAAVALTAVMNIAPAGAVPLTTQLNFSAPKQSMWGPGGSTASFGVNDSWGIGPFSFGYNIGASSGTVSANYNGSLITNHSQIIGLGDSAGVNMRFQGNTNGGNLKSDFGAWAKVTLLGFDLLDEDYGLNINETFTPRIGTTVSGSDDFPATGVEVDVLVAKAGASLNVEQTDDFTVSALKGTLAYHRRGDAQVYTRPFSLTSDGIFGLDVPLDQCGWWDFTIANLTLDNSFDLSFDLLVKVYEQHVDGIRICKKCIWGFCIPIPCGLTYDYNETELASIDVYNGDPFALTFNNIALAQSFSVLVPEPSGISLVGLSVVGAVVTRRRYRRQRGA